MFREKLKILILAALVTALLGGCKPKHYYSATIDVPDQTWHYDSLVNFTVPIDDTSAYYNFSIVIKHDQAYPYANIWLKVISHCPCGALFIDTVNFWLIDEDQRWLGIGTGKNWTVTLPFQDSVHIPETGDMQIYIQHIMRKNDVPHIKAIGLIVDKIK